MRSGKGRLKVDKSVKTVDIKARVEVETAKIEWNRLMEKIKEGDTIA